MVGTRRSVEKSEAPGSSQEDERAGTQGLPAEGLSPKPSKTPRKDILLPVLSKTAHGLWARKFPGAARAYTKLKALKDVTESDMDSWVQKHSKAFALYNNLVEADVSSGDEDEEAVEDVVTIHNIT